MEPNLETVTVSTPTQTNSAPSLFNKKQRDLFRDLSQKMRFVGRWLLPLGILICFIEVIMNGKNDTKYNIILWCQALGQGIVFFFISSSTKQTAISFKKISQPESNDLDDLKVALQKLGGLYRLQRNIVILNLLILFLFCAIIGGIYLWNRLKNQ